MPNFQKRNNLLVPYMIFINLLACSMQVLKNENDMSETSDQLKARFTTGKTVTSESMNALVDAISASSTTKETLKSYFETGDKPTQAQFYELIDAIFAQRPNAIAITNQYVASGHAYHNTFIKTFNIQTGPLLEQNEFNVVMLADNGNDTEFEIRDNNTDIYNNESTCMSGSFYLDIAINFNLYGYNNVMKLQPFMYTGKLPICYGQIEYDILPANAVKVISQSLFVYLYAYSVSSSKGMNVYLQCRTGLPTGFGSMARLVNVNIQQTKLYCYATA